MEVLPEIPDFEVLTCLGYGARSTIYAVCEIRTRQVYALKRVLRAARKMIGFWNRRSRNTPSAVILLIRFCEKVIV